MLFHVCSKRNGGFRHTSCPETDLNGALTSVIASAVTLGEELVFFADSTIRHPEMIMGSCAWTLPYSLWDPNKPARMINAQATWELKKGDITILRCDDINGQYKLFATEGSQMALKQQVPMYGLNSLLEI